MTRDREKNEGAEARFALVACKSSGIKNDLPENYAAFLQAADADFGTAADMQGSFAWRGKNQAARFNCRMAFACADLDHVPFDPAYMDGKTENTSRTAAPAVVKADLYGAARRRTLLWNKKILVQSAQLNFSCPQENDEPLPWHRYVRDSIAEIRGKGKYAQIVKTLVPSAQLRLMSGIHAFPWRSDHQEIKKIIDLEILLNDLYNHSANSPPPPEGSRLAQTQVWTVCMLIGKAELTDPQGGQCDEWRAWPVILPPMPDGDKSDSIKPYDACFVVERVGLPLDDVAIARCTRAIEHFSAHLAQLQSLRKLVYTWWGPLLIAPSWEKKKVAASNFLRAWQQHCMHVDSLWTLGANDPQADPSIVEVLNKAARLSHAWSNENRRLSDLVRLSSQILGDGDPSIHLSRIR